jgi:hypothetical protein
MEDEESYKLWFQEFVNCEEDFYAGDNENEHENNVSMPPSINSVEPVSNNSSISFNDKGSISDSITWNDIIDESTCHKRRSDIVSEALFLIAYTRRRQQLQQKERQECSKSNNIIHLNPRKRQEALSCLRLAFSNTDDEDFNYCPAHFLTLKAFALATQTLGSTSSSDILKMSSNLLTETIIGQCEVKPSQSSPSPLQLFISESITRVAIAAVELGTCQELKDLILPSSLVNIPVEKEQLQKFQDLAYRLDRIEWIITCIQHSSYCAHAAGPGVLCQSQECEESTSGFIFQKQSEIDSPKLDWSELVSKVPGISIFNNNHIPGSPFCFAFYGPSSLALSQSILSNVQQIRKDAAEILAYHTEQIRDSDIYMIRSNESRVTILSIQRWILQYKPILSLLERLVRVFLVAPAAKHLFGPYQTRDNSQDDSVLFSSLSRNIAALARAQRWYGLRTIEAVCREVDLSALISRSTTIPVSQSIHVSSKVLSLDAFPEPLPLSAIAMSILIRTIKAYLGEIESFASANRRSSIPFSLPGSLSTSQRELPLAGLTEGKSTLISTELIISDCLRRAADAAATQDGASNQDDSSALDRNNRIFELAALASRAHHSAIQDDISISNVYSKSGGSWICMHEYAPSFLCISSKSTCEDDMSALSEIVQLRENLALLEIIGGFSCGSNLGSDTDTDDSFSSAEQNLKQVESELTDSPIAKTLCFRPLASIFEFAIGRGLEMCTRVIPVEQNQQENEDDNSALISEMSQDTSVKMPLPISISTQPSLYQESDEIKMKTSSPFPQVSHMVGAKGASSNVQVSRQFPSEDVLSTIRAKPMPGIGYVPLQGTRSSWWDIDAQVEVKKEPKITNDQPLVLQQPASFMTQTVNEFNAILEASHEEDEDDEEEDYDTDEDVERIDNIDDDKILAVFDSDPDVSDQGKEERNSDTITLKKEVSTRSEVIQSDSMTPPGGSPVESENKSKVSSLKEAWTQINPSFGQSIAPQWDVLELLMTTHIDSVIPKSNQIQSSISVREAIKDLFNNGSEFALEPASSQLERTAGISILARSARVSSELSKALFDPKRGAILQQLWSMRAVCFLSESFTMQPFLDKLFSSLASSSSTGSQARSSSHLTLWLRQALAKQYTVRISPDKTLTKRSVKWEPPLEYEKIHKINSNLFSVSIGAFSADSSDDMISKGGIQILYAAENSFGLHYRENSESLIAASRLLFHDTNMEIYNASFSALLRLKRLFWTLNVLSELCNQADKALHEASEVATDLGRSYILERNEQMQRKKRVADRASAEASVELLKSMPRVHAQRRAVLHFISTLYTHTLLNSVLEPWKTLVLRIQKDPSLPSVRAAHSSYLQAVANACHANHNICSAASLTAGSALSKLLTRVDSFSALCIDFCNVVISIANGRSSSRSTAIRLLGAIDTSSASLPRQIAICTNAATSFTGTIGGGIEASFLSTLADSLDANRFYEKLLKR